MRSSVASANWKICRDDKSGLLVWIGNEDTSEIERTDDGRIVAHDASGARHVLPPDAQRTALAWKV